MNKIIPNITNNFQRYLFVFATVFLVLFSSCAIKASVKTLAGISTKTEQDLPQANHNSSVNSVDKCTVGTTSDMQVVQKSSFNANDLLLTSLFTTISLFLLSFVPDKAPSHPLYGNLKISGTLSLFLQYRKLII